MEARVVIRGPLARRLCSTSSRCGHRDDGLKAKPDNYYADELKERFGKGPVTFDFVAILGEAGDPTEDSTAM